LKESYKLQYQRDSVLMTINSLHDAFMTIEFFWRN